LEGAAEGADVVDVSSVREGGTVSRAEADLEEGAAEGADVVALEETAASPMSGSFFSSTLLNRNSPKGERRVTFEGKEVK